jgi:hypothetical protein
MDELPTCFLIRRSGNLSLAGCFPKQSLLPFGLPAIKLKINAIKIKYSFFERKTQSRVGYTNNTK